MKSEAQPRRRQRPRHVLAEFTGAFLRLIDAPSEGRTTVRCLDHSTILRLIGDARDTIADPELRGYSAADLLRTLQTSELLRSLDLEPAAYVGSVFVVGPSDLASVEPVELLGALEPKGVVCYWTALQQYELTTQPPTHHHIARVMLRARQTRRPIDLAATSPTPAAQRRNPLGTHLLDFEGQPYYRTARGAHTLAGVQLRRLSEKTLMRITTREQTLLDTLHRPLSCGGPSVVWEAWTRGIETMDPRRLGEYLTVLNDARWTRRVGFVLQSLNYAATGPLGDLLARARLSAEDANGTDLIPLLPGVAGVETDPIWRVVVA